ALPVFRRTSSRTRRPRPCRAAAWGPRRRSFPRTGTRRTPRDRDRPSSLRTRARYRPPVARGRAWVAPPRQPRAQRRGGPRSIVSCHASWHRRYHARMANSFVHFNLHTGDLPKAREFYGQLFAWKFTSLPTPKGIFTLVDVGEGTGGGMMT